MKNFLTILLFVGNLFFVSVAFAEIQTYEGFGEYLMSDFETFDVAQQRAKKRAEQNACEQAGVYVESRTEVRNAKVTKDEIITMTSGILKILDIQYKREIINDNTTRIRVIIKAQIDSEDVTKWLAKGAQERSTLVAQNEELRRANAEQDKQIAELKRQLADVKTQKERERIKKEIIDVDKKFLPSQDKKTLYSNFTEIVRIVNFTPLYMPQNLGYEITSTAIYAESSIVEICYGRRWEPKVSLSVRTYKRAEGEELKDISGVTGVKWRVDTTTGTPLYIAKISNTQQVAAWSVGQYIFSVQAENLSFSAFRKLVVDELVELTMHYYIS